MMMAAGEFDSLIKERLESGRCENVRIVGGTKPGDNYGSTFLFLKAGIVDESKPEGQQKYDLDLVAKKIPPTEYLQEMFKVNVTFKKEAQFYRTLIPEYEACQRECNVAPKDRLDLFAKMYGARGDGEDDVVDNDAILVLENIAVQGFKMASRKQGLDLAHCKLVLQELAKFHALGIALRKKKPATFWGPIQRATVFARRRNTLEETVEELKSIIFNTFDMCEKELPDVQPSLSQVKEKMVGMLKKFAERPEVDAEPFLTVIHKDFWTNNMMFSYEKGEPKSLRMYDLQFTETNSPVYDLVFFLYTSAQLPVLREHYSALLKIYHGSLFSYLEFHGVASDDLDWEAFLQEHARVGPLVTILVFFMTNIIYAEQKNNLETTESADAFNQISPTKVGLEKYSFFFDDWVRKGWY